MCQHNVQEILAQRGDDVSITSSEKESLQEMLSSVSQKLPRKMTSGRLAEVLVLLMSGTLVRRENCSFC